MVEVDNKKVSNSNDEFIGPPRPRTFLSSPPSPWNTSKNFLEFLFKSLRPDSSYSLPPTLSRNDLNYLIDAWNKKHPKELIRRDDDPLNQLQATHLDNLSNQLSLFPVVAQYRRLNPTSTLNLSVHTGASTSQPVKTPEIEFNKWIGNLYAKGAKGGQGLAGEVYRRMLKGSLTRIDFQFFLDSFAASHPGQSLGKLPETMSPVKVKDYFPEIKLPALTIADSLVPIAACFLTGKMPEKLSAEQKDKISLIQRDIRGEHLSAAERNKIEGVVKQLTPFMPPNSPIVQLRMRHIREEYAYVFKLGCEVRAREAKGEATVKDKQLKDWIPKRLQQIEAQYKTLPHGANDFRLSQARLREEIKEGDRYTIESATIALNNELKARILYKLAPFDQGPTGEITKKLQALPSGADVKTITKTIETITKEFGNDTHWIDDHVENYYRARTYLINCSQKGFIENIELDNAKRLLSADARSMDPGSPYTGEFQRNVAQFGENSRELEEGAQKAGALTLQILGSAAAVATQQYETIPFIWLSGPAAAIATRAYVEDTNLIDAAYKELKVNQIFGTPGNVISEHLTGKDAPPAWKLLLIDVLSLGALEGGILRGAKSIAKAGSLSGALSAEASGFVNDVDALAKKWNLKLSPREKFALAAGLAKASKDGHLGIFVDANNALAGRELPASLKAFLAKQGGKLVSDAPKGIPDRAILNMATEDVSNITLKQVGNETIIETGGKKLSIPANVSLEIVDINPTTKASFVRTTSGKLIDIGAIAKFGWENTIALQQQLETIYQAGSDLVILGHGTSRTGEEVNSILADGLFIKNGRGDLYSTATELSGYSKMENSIDRASLAVSRIAKWPHMNRETVIILGIPRDVGLRVAQLIDDIPGLRQKVRMSNRDFVLAPRYIIGFVDEHGILHGNPRFNPFSGGVYILGIGYRKFDALESASADSFFSSFPSRLNSNEVKQFLDQCIKKGEVVLPGNFTKLDANFLGYCRHLSGEANKLGYELSAPVYSRADKSIKLNIRRIAVKDIPKNAPLTMLQESRFGDPALSLKGYKPEKPLGVGKASKCFSVQGNPNLVMIEVTKPGGYSFDMWRKVTQYSDNIRDSIVTVQRYEELPPSVHAPRVLGFQIEGDKVWRIMEKSPGKELFPALGEITGEQYTRRLAEIADAPQAHFDKLISDFKTIKDAGLQIDASKPDNFFYDPKTGFHFIDLDPHISPLIDTRPESIRSSFGRPSTLIAPLIFSQRVRHLAAASQLSAEAVRSIEKIIEKLNKAGADVESQLLRRIKENIKQPPSMLP